RTMAAFEAVLSLGLAIAYILAGPVLRALGPQPVYRLGGLTALAAAITLAPLVWLRREPQPDQLVDPGPRYTSAEALDSEPLASLDAGRGPSSSSRATRPAAPPTRCHPGRRPRPSRSPR